MGTRYFKLNKSGRHTGYYVDKQSPDSCSFSAPNMDQAVKIAFNRWLAQFDRLLRSCDNVQIGDGWFSVDIHTHRSGSGEIASTRTIRHTVRRIGGIDMYKAPHNQREGMVA